MPGRIIAATLLFTVVFLASFARAVGASPAGEPNVVVFLADDLGYSDLGCYGSEIATPNLDALAKGGLRFTDFYNTGRCCPSRASLLTGLYPHQAGVGHMVDPYAKPVRDKLDSPAYQDHLSERCATIADVLRPAGYRTLMCGKWHLGYRPGEWPVRRGFDRSLVQVDGAMNYWGRGVQHTPGDVPPMALDERAWEPPEGFFATDAYSGRAADFIGEASARGQPFFLYLAFNAPHWPLHAPAEDVAKYRGKYAGGWEAVRQARRRRQLEMGLVDEKWGMAPPDGGNNKPWDQLTDAERDEWDLRMAVYAAQVERMDRGVGTVLARIRKLGLERETLVLFLSDNGGAAENPNKGKAGAVTGTRESYVGYARPWATVSNTPLRLHKIRVHEGGISAPAIAYWPGVVKNEGSLARDPAHLIDVMATVVEATGAAYPKEREGHPVPPTEGTSLLPVLRGGVLAERTLYWEHEGHRAVRRGRWKLVAEHGRPWELYDLAADRAEAKDLARAEPGRVRELEALYQAWATRCGVRPWQGK
jgi:arylsulfatase